MWGRINLRNRIYANLTSLMLITLVGGLIMVGYTYRIEGLLTTVIDRNMAAFKAAGALETVLVNPSILLSDVWFKFKRSQTASRPMRMSADFPSNCLKPRKRSAG